MGTLAMSDTEPRQLSVVVVDDEPDVAVYLAAVLEKKGHEAHTAGNAADGFALVKSLRPDVACIDIVMPEETGVALFRKIRADDEVGETPVVFITALKPEMATPHDGMNVEPIPKADEYVEKPPDSEAFVEAVERAARSRRVRK
jgi:CheY-like chemotaxis protein